MTTIKAIETRYKGCLFRSRLEARWAVFFDTLGLRWRYETEGFKVGEMFCYLPDFYLPDWDTYLEVKPDLPTDDFGDGIVLVVDREKHTTMSKLILAGEALKQGNGTDGKPVKNRLYMLCGTPGVPQLRYYKGVWRLDDGSCIVHAFLARLDSEQPAKPFFPISAWTDTPTGEVDIWPYYVGGVICDGTHDNPYLPGEVGIRFYIGTGKRSYCTPRLIQAYAAARSARFEHGQSGAQ